MATVGGRLACGWPPACAPPCFAKLLARRAAENYSFSEGQPTEAGLYNDVDAGLQ